MPTQRDGKTETELQKAIARAKARLSDMQIQEVSLVDRAANNRTFLIIKRDTSRAENAATFTALYNAALAVPEPPVELAKSISQSRAAAALLRHFDGLRPAERVVLAKMAKGLL